MGFDAAEHFFCIVPRSAGYQDAHIRESQDPLNAVHDVDSRFEVVAGIEIEPLLVQGLVIDKPSWIFLDKHAFADRFMDGFGPVVLRRGVEDMEQFPEIGLKVEPAILDGLLGQRIDAQTFGLAFPMAEATSPVFMFLASSTLFVPLAKARRTSVPFL